MRARGMLKPISPSQLSPAGKSKTGIRSVSALDSPDRIPTLQRSPKRRNLTKTSRVQLAPAVSVNVEHLEEIDNVSLSCPHCPRLFVRNSALEKHLETHAKQKRFRCLHCTKSFKSKAAVTRHLRCHLRKKTFDFGQANRKHGQPTMKLKNLRCVHCNKIIPSETVLKPFGGSNYNISPSKLKQSCSFTCNACNKAFVQSPNLRTQVRGQTGDSRPLSARNLFQCPHCSKNFIKRSLLTKHVRTRTLERPYKCVHCCKAFSTSENLSAHSRSHDRQNSTHQLQLPMIS